MNFQSWLSMEQNFHNLDYQRNGKFTIQTVILQFGISMEKA